MSKQILVTIGYYHVVVPAEVLPYIDKFEVVTKEHTKDYRTSYFLRDLEAELTVNFVSPSSIRDEKIVDPDPADATPATPPDRVIASPAPMFDASTDRPAIVQIPDTREFVDEWRS